MQQKTANFVPVEARGTGDRYAMNTSTGELRRRDPKPHRNKKVRRREREARWRREDTPRTQD